MYTDMDREIGKDTVTGIDSNIDTDTDIDKNMDADKDINTDMELEMNKIIFKGHGHAPRTLAYK
jgi:hypothetical protein